MHRFSIQEIGVLAILLALGPTLPAAAQIRPDPDALAAASPALVARMRDDPYVYFRFVNRPWTARVCAALPPGLAKLPPARLHGDAHIEQYALTKDAFGLDDFDDSAAGPAVVDILRFLGSLDLAVRQRGWQDRRNALFDRFFAGYYHGLSDPDAPAALSAIVRRLRAQPLQSPEDFLAKGEQLMSPLSGDQRHDLDLGMEVFEEKLRKERPGIPRGYLTVVSAGWLNLGVGSAVNRKLLVRIQGASEEPADDELLEAKRLGRLDGVSCLNVVSVPPALRIVLGASHMGRLKHHILTAGPDLPTAIRGTDTSYVRQWWIRTWDPSYQEIRVADVQSPDELLGVAYDAGLQLGQGNLHEQQGEQGRNVRQQMAQALHDAESGLREEAVELIDELLVGWRELSARPR